MSTDDDMPDSWNRNGGGRSEITAAIVRAREARAGTAQAPVDELALRRSARLAAEDARRRLRSTEPPPGPRTA